MDSISENLNSELSNTWDDYSLAKEAIDQASYIGRIANITSVVSCVVLIAARTSPLIHVAYIMNGVVLGSLALFSTYVLRKHCYHPPYFSATLLAFSLPWCGPCTLPNLIRFGLPTFIAMCLYSAYLQTKGLTQRGFLELALERLKKIIASDESLDCVLIDKVSKKWDRTYLSINSKELQVQDCNDLLIKAYESKKILQFSHLMQKHPTKNQFSHFIYVNGALIPIYKSVYLSNAEIFNELKSTVWYNGYEEKILNSFKIAVDYLIECKKNDKDLDESYINQQLQCLTLSWGYDQDYPPLKLNSNIVLKNGNPVISTRFGELGDYSAFKLELQKYFDQVTDVTEGADSLFC